jgi:hypothetical protein
MSFRLPRSLGDAVGDQRAAAHNAFEAEVLAEKAAALGRAGRQAETALAALRDSDAPVGGPERERLLDAAAERFWAFLVQRELCGLHDHERVIADLAVPREVINRGGAIRRRS